MSQLLEKKMKIREDKKRPINFPYFLAGAKRLNKLFILGGRMYEVGSFIQVPSYHRGIIFYWHDYLGNFLFNYLIYF
ncbi:hypothetical protein IV70_GL002788 [Carnobacterium maltaromaticum DSM 20342]|nr:hypothetical protein IV70_GL002788 [Carnobacterium maltaromaticum DSM 20342]